MKRKVYNDDDGRIIANMNVEGTPWYVPCRKTDADPAQDRNVPGVKETWHIIKGALAAGLLIGSVFIVAFYLFILFCTEIWFK